MESDRLGMIGAALDFIERHLEDDIALEDVARAVHYSKYYLHRRFPACWAPLCTSISAGDG